MKINNKEKRDHSQNSGRQSVNRMGRLSNKRLELMEVIVYIQGPEKEEGFSMNGGLSGLVFIGLVSLEQDC